MDYTFAKSMESYLGSILNVTKGKHEARAFIRKYIDGKEVLVMDMARSAY